MIKTWLKLTNEMALLGLEAQQVIGMRLMRIAAGGKGARSENERMVTEKIAAAQGSHDPHNRWFSGKGRAALSQPRSQEQDARLSSQDTVGRTQLPGSSIG